MYPHREALISRPSSTLRAPFSPPSQRRRKSAQPSHQVRQEAATSTSFRKVSANTTEISFESSAVSTSKGGATKGKGKGKGRDKGKNKDTGKGKGKGKQKSQPPEDASSSSDLPESITAALGRGTHDHSPHTHSAVADNDDNGGDNSGDDGSDDSGDNGDDNSEDNGGNDSDDSISEIRTIDNDMDLNPNDVSVEWQQAAAMRMDMKATLFQFMALRSDPFTIDQKPNQLLELIQWMVQLLFPDKVFTVTRKCILYKNLRQAILSWRSYFLKVPTRCVSAELRRKNLAVCTNGVVSFIDEKNKDEVIKFVNKLVDSGRAFYKLPSKNAVDRRGPYQSVLVLRTFVSAYAKKIKQSLLRKMYPKEIFPFPSGALLLAGYGVHLALSQFNSGEYISASFSEDASPKILEGHVRNVKAFTKEDEDDFLESIARYVPSVAPRRRVSSAFTSVPMIVSFHRR
ncbi:hypothetical protein NLI96_g4630 [Meripilus lineatus]|uniref:DUF6532 domain-containing protein n=1 Tax=Meripilus lineatus TaxID=2056292 RepID=A0AAD5V473_9APHY|nr:hypothetical protein NLI96_g4630 [Physisporinus lineatus]